MPTGTITQKLRPLRIAFLVNPADRAGIQRAIELSSMLWGGALNPIVPVFPNRLPRIWHREKYFRTESPSKIVNGYLDGFDPDIIVPVGDSPSGRYEAGNREVVQPNDLIGDLSRNGRTAYGVGAFELCRYIAEKEFKFQRKAPLNLVAPKFVPAHRLFLSAVFGAWPEEVAALVRKHLGETLDLKEPECRIASFDELLGITNLFPRRIGLTDINYRPRDATVFCLDATNALDVLDFWNLRAAGFYVIAAPKQAFEAEGLRRYVSSFVESSYTVHRHNPNYRYRTTFQVGRSIGEEEVQAFAKSLGIESAGDDPKYMVRWWYPRLWDKWAREETDERVEPFFSAEREVPIKDSGESLDLRTLDPPFESSRVWTNAPRYANEIAYRIYNAEQPMAEVLPEGSKELGQRISHGALREFRLSRSGPVYLVEHSEGRVYFEIPSAEHFMRCWFQDKGFRANLSSAGLIATQMLKRLKGKFGVGIIDYEGVIKLLDRHASEKGDPANPEVPRAPKWIQEGPLLGELSRILKEEESLVERDRYLRLLLERDVLRLGLQLHCPTCTRWLWKPMAELDEQVECEHCLTKFSLAAAPREERAWSYKPIGPFNVRGFAGGAYPVLLAWKFFEGRFTRETTPLFSFAAVKGNLTLEVDLALFCRDGEWRGPKNELLLVECKAYDEFKKVDLKRMNALAAHFPGAFLVFAKLGRNLTSGEVRLLTQLVNRQRRLWKARKPFSPVMVLTGTELYSEWGVPECWKDMEGRHKGAYEKWGSLRSLSSLAESTQEIYLGVPSMHEWIGGRRTRHEARKAHSNAAGSRASV